MASFSDYDLLPSLQAILAEQDITTPTEIQMRALPELLTGRSIVGIAETGSGKTLSYVLPLLHQLKTLENAGSAVTVARKPRAIVVVPGRELGEQVTRVFKQFTHTTRLRVRAALGGAALEVARRNVNGPFEVLVATPGRLLQLIDTGSALDRSSGSTKQRDTLLDLSDVRTLVFDEADQMLDPSFLPNAVKIVSAVPPAHQLALFSATLPVGLETLITELFRRPPIRIQTKGSNKLVPTLTTINRSVEGGQRFPLLQTVLTERPSGGTLLFVNTRAQCDTLAGQLEAAAIPFAMFRGEMDKVERRANLARFRSGEVTLLLATDLGSRGLDIDSVARVINYHMPQQMESYLHRAGRTARAGRSGVVINFVTERDERIMEKIVRKSKK